MSLQATADRLEFTPPPEPRPLAATGLALVAHLLLVGALGWGITWNRDPRAVTAEAELWAANVQLAAPALVETPPPPPPPPAPTPPPAPAPVITPPAPPPPQVRDATIAVEREKEERRKKEEKALAAQEKARKERAEKEAREAAAKKAAEKKAAALAEKKAKENKVPEKKAAEKAERERLAREAAEAQRATQLREENLKRMQGLAGATGAPTATGTALKSAGPSTSYAAKIQAKVQPNIFFAETVAGNPVAEVEVKLAPDGRITERRITKSSGVKGWDEAVLRALDRTEVLPKDVDGRVITPLLIEFKPKGL